MNEGKKQRKSNRRRKRRERWIGPLIIRRVEGSRCREETNTTSGETNEKSIAIEQQAKRKGGMY